MPLTLTLLIHLLYKNQKINIKPPSHEKENLKTVKIGSRIFMRAFGIGSLPKQGFANGRTPPALQRKRPHGLEACGQRFNGSRRRNDSRRRRHGLALLGGRKVWQLQISH